MKVGLVIFLASWVLTSSASAQDAVVPLITVVEETSVEAPVWWAGDTAFYSPFDRALGSSEPKYFKWGWAEDLTKISKILRRPELSDANAVALASVLGSRYALVGAVTVGKMASIGPFDPEGVRAKLVGRLLKRTPKGVVAIREFSFEAVSFAQSDASTMALRSLASDVVLGVDKSLKPGPQARGGASEETVIVLKGATSAAQIDAVRNRLLSHAAVDAIRIAWAASGVVALEINPNTPDASETLTRVAQVLSVAFDDFDAVPRNSPFVNALEFELKAR